MTYNTDIEFPKIVDAFDRVKYDVTTVFEAVARLERRSKAQDMLIEELRQKISKLKKTEKTKIIRTVQPKTVTKTITKKVGEKVAIVGNKDSMKAHRETCPYAQNILKENFVKFRSANDAFKKGYSACQCMKGKAHGKK